MLRASMDPRIINLIQKIEIEGDDRVNMIAIAKIGKNYVIGRNRYDRKPKSYFGYPPISGVHAELDLFLKINSLGLLEEKIDFIFVFGKRKRFLQNTKPCIYCSNILRNLRFKYIYYFEKGNLVKKTKEEFLLEEDFKDYFI